MDLPADLQSALGPAAGLFYDPQVTNVQFNPSGSVVVMKTGESWTETELSFDTAARQMILSTVAGEMDLVANADSPIVQGSFCGDRIRATGFHSTVGNGEPSVTFRIQPAKRFSLAELVEREMLDEETAADLVRWMIEGKTIAIAGKTNSGKTTLTRALLMEVLRQEPLRRVVTIEVSSPELSLKSGPGVQVGTNVIELVSGARGNRITPRELLSAALRANADSLVMGEVRGPEAFELMLAERSGHSGSAFTLHAGSAKEVLQQLSDFTGAGPEATSELSWARIIRIVVNVSEAFGVRKVRSIEQISVEDRRIEIEERTLWSIR